jgi:hypothetical protein
LVRSSLGCRLPIVFSFRILSINNLLDSQISPFFVRIIQFLIKIKAEKLENLCININNLFCCLILRRIRRSLPTCEKQGLAETPWLDRKKKTKREVKESLAFTYGRFLTIITMTTAAKAIATIIAMVAPAMYIARGSCCTAVCAVGTGCASTAWKLVADADP